MLHVLDLKKKKKKASSLFTWQNIEGYFRFQSDPDQKGYFRFQSDPDQKGYFRFQSDPDQKGYFRFQSNPDQKADSILSSVVLQKDREMLPIGETSPILPSA